MGQRLKNIDQSFHEISQGKVLSRELKLPSFDPGNVEGLVHLLKKDLARRGSDFGVAFLLRR